MLPRLDNKSKYFSMNVVFVVKLECGINPSSGSYLQLNELNLQ